MRPETARGGVRGGCKRDQKFWHREKAWHIRLAIFALGLWALALSGVQPANGAEDTVEVRIAYLGQHVERSPALSNLEWL